MSELYMLDTDVMSFLIKRNQTALARFRAIGEDRCCISVITEAEQLAGMTRMTPGSALHLTTQRFLESIRIESWTSECALAFAEIYTSLSHQRRQIGDLDTMIAAHARALGATLVTNNMRHFSRIPNVLRLENWLETNEPGS